MRAMGSSLAILVLAALAACGPAQTTSASTTPSVALWGVFTLTDSGCGYEGNDIVSARRGTITLSNKISNEAHFDFFRLNQGHNYAELVAHIQEEERRRLAGEAELGHPTFATLSSSTTVAAHVNQSLQIPETAGSYGMVCIRWNLGPLRMFAAGPLTVS